MTNFEGQRKTSPMILADRIAEMAKAIAPKYPDIDKCDLFEQLYAIESSYLGTKDANQDLHKLIAVLRERLGMSVGEMIDLSDSIQE